MARIFFMLGCACIGQLTFRVSPSLTLSDLFFIISLFFVIAKICIGKQNICRIDAYMLIGIMFVILGSLMTGFFIDSQVEHLTILSKFIFSSLIIIFLSQTILKRIKDIELVLLALGFSAALNGFGAILQLLVNPAIIPNTLPHYSRMTGFTQHVNDLGSSCAMMFIPLLLFSVNNNKSFYRFLGLIFIGLMVSGLFLSGSLSSIGSVSLGLLFVITISKIKLYQKVMILIMPIMLSFFILNVESNELSLQSIVDRVFSGGETYESTAGSRLKSYQVSLSAISNNPFLGVGLKSGGSETEAGIAVHNVFLNAWYEIGFLGFLGLVIMIIGTIVKVFNVRKKQWMFNEKKIKFILIGMQGGVLCFIFYCMTAPALIQRHLWIIIGVAIASVKLIRYLEKNKSNRY